MLKEQNNGLLNLFHRQFLLLSDGDEADWLAEHLQSVLECVGLLLAPGALRQLVSQELNHALVLENARNLL